MHPIILRDSVPWVSVKNLRGPRLKWALSLALQPCFMTPLKHSKEMFLPKAWQFKPLVRCEYRKRSSCFLGMLRRQPCTRLLLPSIFFKLDGYHTPQQTRYKSIDEMKTVLAERLYAAKPLAWRGRGELTQLPWSTPCSGLLLVVDLCTSLTGLLVALLALGVAFCGTVSTTESAPVTS